MDSYLRRRLIRHLERARRAYELHLRSIDAGSNDPTSPAELTAAIDDVDALLNMLKDGVPLNQPDKEED